MRDVHIKDALKKLDAALLARRPKLAELFPPRPLEHVKTIETLERRAKLEIAPAWRAYWLTPSISAWVAAASSGFLQPADFELSTIPEALRQRHKELAHVRETRRDARRDEAKVPKLPADLSVPIGRVGNGDHAWIRSGDDRLYEVSHGTGELTHSYALIEVLTETRRRLEDARWALAGGFLLRQINKANDNRLTRADQGSELRRLGALCASQGDPTTGIALLRQAVRSIPRTHESVIETSFALAQALEPVDRDAAIEVYGDLRKRRVAPYNHWAKLALTKLGVR